MSDAMAPWHRGRSKQVRRCKAKTRIKLKNGRFRQCKHKTTRTYCRIHRAGGGRQGALLSHRGRKH